MLYYADTCTRNSPWHFRLNKKIIFIFTKAIKNHFLVCKRNTNNVTMLMTSIVITS